MASHLKITDESLAEAGRSLVSAANQLAAGSTGAPAGDLESLTGIGDEIRRFMNGLRTGRLALADGAKTAGAEVAGIMADSSDLDARISEALYAGFAVQGRGS